MLRQLFGGAIQCAVPDSYVDVSAVREIPDNEEVLIESETDSCFIVEILECKEGVPDAEIAKFHFENIADENEAISFAIESSEAVNRPGERFGTLFCAVGKQTGIVKFREQDRRGNDIIVFLAVARIKDLNADLVISLSAPSSISEASSSHAQGAKPDVERALAVWKQVIGTFSIKDYGLFA